MRSTASLPGLFLAGRVCLKGCWECALDEEAARDSSHSLLSLSLLLRIMICFGPDLFCSRAFQMNRPGLGCPPHIRGSSLVSTCVSVSGVWGPCRERRDRPRKA